MSTFFNVLFLLVNLTTIYVLYASMNRFIVFSKSAWEDSIEPYNKLCAQMRDLVNLQTREALETRNEQAQLRKAFLDLKNDQAIYISLLAQIKDKIGKHHD